MARTRQAYSQLKRAINTTGFVAAPGTPAGNYIAYLKNERERGKPKTARVGSSEKGRLLGGVVPFYRPASVTFTSTADLMGAYVTIYSAKMAAPGLTNLTSASARTPLANVVTGAELGFFAPGTVTTEDAGFYSSQIVIRRSTGTASKVTSGVTGRKYSYRNTDTITLPFGKVAATSSESERFNVIKASLEAPAGTNSTTPQGLGYQLNPERKVGQRNVGNIS